MTYLTELGLLGNTVGLVISVALTFIFVSGIHEGFLGIKLRNDEEESARHLSHSAIDESFKKAYMEAKTDKEKRRIEMDIADMKLDATLRIKNNKERIYEDLEGRRYHRTFNEYYGLILFFSALSFIGGFGSLFFAVKLVKSVWEL
jgi:hypothetical protein